MKFPMWSAVITPSFECKMIRATIAPSEGHFNEFKNRTLCHYLGKIRLQKFCIDYWRAIQRRAIIRSRQLTHMRLQPLDRKKVENYDKIKPWVGNDDICKSPKAREEGESAISGTNYDTFFKQQGTISSDENPDIHTYNNWRNKAKRNDPLSKSDLPQKNACEKTRIIVFNISPESQLLHYDAVPGKNPKI